jgi:hypothetical protein
MKRLYNGVGMLGIPGALNEKDNKAVTFAIVSYVFATVVTLYKKINGFISYGDGEHGMNAGNMDAQVVFHTFIAANVNETIPHRLGRVPIGYDVFRSDRAATVYDTDSGSWSDTLIMLKSNVAGHTVKMRIY